MADQLLDADTDLVVMLDESVIVPCDTEQCNLPAAWSWRCEGCALVVLVCTPHKVLADVYIARCVTLVGAVACERCRRKLPNPFPWLPL